MEEKLSMLYQLVQLAMKNGDVVEDEYDFLERIAHNIGVLPDDFDRIIGGDVIKFTPPKEEHARLIQLYRLMLMMHVDGKVCEEEIRYVRMAGMRLGLPDSMIQALLLEAEKSEAGIIEEERLIDIWRSVNN